MLVIFAGLPGVGKSTVSRALAQRIGALYLRMDTIEWAIGATDDAGYRVGYAIAEDNLRIGRTVVADSVNPVEASRAGWRGAAERCGRGAVEIEVICSDLAGRGVAGLAGGAGSRIPCVDPRQDRRRYGAGIRGRDREGACREVGKLKPARFRSCAQDARSDFSPTG